MSLKQDKLKYLNAAIKYYNGNIQDIKEDLKGANFATQCLLFGKINEYKDKIEDTIDMIKETILEDEQEEIDESALDDQEDPNNLPDIINGTKEEVPSRINFNEFLELTGLFFVLVSNGYGFITKGHADLIPYAVDLINLNTNMYVAKNIQNFQQLMEVLKDFSNK